MPERTKIFVVELTAPDGRGEFTTDDVFQALIHSLFSGKTGLIEEAGACMVTDRTDALDGDQDA